MEKSCGLVLFNADKVLLLNYSLNNETGGGGHWDFPKGHVELNETEIETALRELKEETGIDEVFLFDDFREVINYNIRKASVLIPKKVVFFVGKTNVKNVNLSIEHQNYLWLNYEKALSKLTYDNARNVLKKAVVFVQKTNV